MTNQTPCRSSCWCRRTISRKRRRTRLRTTAPPRRPEVMNPARQEFSTGITLKIRSLPRCVMPSRFTRTYSERCVKRRAFGKENEPGVHIWNANSPSPDHPTSRAISQLRRLLATSVQKKSSTEDRRKTPKRTNRQLIARVTQQVFPLCRPAIQLLQRDSFQSQARWWEPELSQERQFRFFVRTPREGRLRPECRCISS